MRLNLLLLAIVMASALFLVRTQYESRRLYTAIDRAQSEAKRLETEKDRLRVEVRAQAVPARVEKLATTRLQMRPATPAISQYLTPAGSALAPAGGGS